MVRTQPNTGATDWRKRMSDQVAYALLVYTGLQIFLTMGALQGARASLLPYFALVALVGAIIPVCRGCDRHWQTLDPGAASDPALASAYRRDCRKLWALALGLPVALTVLLRLLTMAFAG